MNQNSMDDFYTLASIIPPDQVSQYLHAQGWDLFDSRDGLLEEWAEPTAPEGESESEIHLLPMNVTYRDFRRRFVEFLAAVANYYEIDAAELSHRIRVESADVLLFRLSHDDDHSDSVGIDEANGVLRVAQRMLAMSARYTASPGKEFTGRMRPEAREYVAKHVSLGHTRKGSFIFPILSGPRSGRGPGALFARRVMENLAVGLHRVQSLPDAAYPAVSDEFAPLVIALADSLQAFSKVPGFQLVDISFRWASGRKITRGIPDRPITLESEIIDRIALSGTRAREFLQSRLGDSNRFELMATRRMADRPAPAPSLPPAETVEISGQVVALQIDDRRIEDWGSRYSFVLRSESRDEIFDVQIPVSESDYYAAVEARNSGVTTTAVGVLSRTGNGILLEGEVAFGGQRRR
ncbi:hypothetical protein [Streptomyces rugosispiralis]|uniref:Uncharacterized protein n=1 Tax=Streptomyces rugosispiralis TaxID=2967341 RepID=A0ABT1V1E3_9ACTN|nr:hypothetical protein [Streptomyces rugosispiralis]MCQ8190619.1 hypothetical protein [Streptomyces rugosispiralis]